MESRVKEVLNFIDSYTKASNAATGSKYDSNANVTCKNIGTLSSECVKKLNIDVQRQLAYNYIEKSYDKDLADQYLEDLRKHIIYTHDESTGGGGMPYCCSISLYPFLLNGLKDLGGSSQPPKHTNSYIGGLINLIFLVAAQFAGAVAIPEFLPYMDHFLRLDYGDDYIDHLDEEFGRISDHSITIRHMIEDWFQQFVYSINQPAGSRNYQSPFTNIAYYDKYYFESIFKDFFFPDGDEPKWETTKELQKLFMQWFANERLKDVLTFPVETVNLLWDSETKEYKDKEMTDFTAEMMSKGHNPFIYNSDSADALSSCCRLKNAIEENVFSYTLGAGGIETGSKRVITLNINRIVQNWDREGRKVSLSEYITPIVNRVHAYLDSWNNKLWDDYNAGLLPIYKAGFIDLDKQYVTVGFNGFIEAAEYLKITTRSDDEEYKQFAKDILGTIKDLNKAHRKEHLKINTEMVPAEGLGPKHYKWDKEDGYWVPENRNCYNSYFYPVEDATYDVLEKMKLQGTDFIGCLDGGSAAHINLDEHLSKDQYRKLLDLAIQFGCSYLTFNVPMYACDDSSCGYISKTKIDKCPKCGATVTPVTRIIGYLKKVSNFSEARQKEAAQRYYGDVVDAEVRK